MNIELSWLDYQKDIFFEFPDKVKYKIIPKGRRSGITKGGANAFIKKLVKKEGPLLWGDTINGNIQRYYERYFLPVLKKNNIIHRFDQINKKLEIGNQFADFRSEDNPENWEGFGYKYIFLNEAGIILKNKHLYVNSVLPMLLDYPESKLIAAGVPKGKILKDGTQHPFYTLHERAQADPVTYQSRRFTTYDNPILDIEDIKSLEKEMFAIGGQPNVDQEIYGLFVDYAAENPFFTHYDAIKHESKEAVFDERKQVHVWMDFNINPFAVVFAHIWQDTSGYHCHVFDEAEIKNGSIPVMAELIRKRYGPQLPNVRLTGDKGGDKKSIEQSDNAGFYIQLKRLLGLRDSQVVTHPNPTHSHSRGQCNYFMCNFPDFKVNPVKCPNVCRDMKTVQANGWGEIIKTNRNIISQQSDFADCIRYGINDDPINSWIKFHSKLSKIR